MTSLTGVGGRYERFDPPPPGGGGAEGDGGGGPRNRGYLFLPLRLASASHLPLAGEDREFAQYRPQVNFEDSA